LNLIHTIGDMTNDSSRVYIPLNFEKNRRKTSIFSGIKVRHRSHTEIIGRPTAVHSAVHSIAVDVKTIHDVYWRRVRDYSILIYVSDLL